VGLPLEYSRAGGVLDSVPLPLGLSLLLALLLVLMNAFFAAAETAIGRTRPGRFHALKELGSLSGRSAGRIGENPRGFLFVCQMGITLATLGMGLWGALVIGSLFQPVIDSGMLAALIGLVLVLPVHLLAGEQLPKHVAASNPEKMLLHCAVLLTFMYRIVHPAYRLLTTGFRRIAEGAGMEPERNVEALHNSTDIRLLVEESRGNGSLDHTEFTLVRNIFSFSETSAREVMIPRTEMVCLFAQLPYRENMAIALEEQLTRYPVCDPDKDTVIGFIHIKDLLRPGVGEKDLRSFIRPLISVPETIPISSLLGLMQKRKTQMALLIDEYGGTSGLVTAEDILEEIVGEIQDEFDEERPAVEAAGNDIWSVNGLMLLEEVNEQLGLSLISEDYDTLGGWLYAQLESPPHRHQRIRTGGCELMVEEVDHLRISRVLIRLYTQEEEGEIA
jgi:CBS domain containing-hemolysin-like protein